jgi:adenylyltransferase/sulfurtransferase
MLSEIQIERYSRQIILPQLGGKGQEKLLDARVLVNGAGPLQTTVLLYLAAAGVGTIGVRAYDQAHEMLPLFSAFSPQSGRRQMSEVVATLSRLNPDCTVVEHVCSDEQIMQADKHAHDYAYDLLVSDPDPLLDQWYASGRSFCCSWGQAAEGRLFVCGGGADEPCFQCIPTEQRVFKTAGGPSLTERQIHESARFELLASLFWGAFQATEALKCIIGLGVASQGRLFECQFPDLQFAEQLVHKDPNCSRCSSAG